MQKSAFCMVLVALTVISVPFPFYWATLFVQQDGISFAHSRKASRKNAIWAEKIRNQQKARNLVRTLILVLDEHLRAPVDKRNKHCMFDRENM